MNRAPTMNLNPPVHEPREAESLIEGTA